ncbi:TonB-dependent siderophore receptor [Campylobacter sp. CCUG 57310]|uniref:TonB-dependent receptor plug domain-containing protein n=1 Tax=Campylobacter sp. CCUG 57310 TaxID=2517362 RepID=UPI0015656A7F|nr:TonB-dependent receptor plug domain-containing protein [Campylobacter sp. CCUG 57310]QKF91764.1 TonB-dependent receptor [Campylobacter sp. CCUG 57310]
MKNKFLMLSSITAIAICSYAKDVELRDLNVTANLSGVESVTKQGKYLGSTSVSKETISSIPSLNRGLTDILKTNPSVQFSNIQITSKNSGEIDPQDISINGAKFYQNNFMIDGLNINNDLNPSARVSEQVNIPGKIFPDLGSISQGINLDAGLVDTLNVYDSSISSRYGGFQGGVIEAKTRNPRKGFHGKLSTSYSSDKWTKFYIDDIEQEEFKNSYSHTSQPKFTKWKQILELEGYLTDDFGLLFNYSQTRSKIPLVGYDKRFVSDKKDSYEQERIQRRKNENFFLKANWFATDRLTITPTIIYAPNSGIYFNDTTKDSKQTMKSGGLTASVDLNYDFDLLNFKQIFGYSKLESSRDSEKEYWIQWQPSNKRPWGSRASFEGGYGDINQEQESFSYAATLEFEPIDFLNIEHNFATGFDYRYSKGSYKIPNGFYTVTATRNLKPGEACSPNDPWCSMDAGNGGVNHYATIWEKYSKGKIDAKINQFALWFEDEMRLGNLILRPGLRFDSDDYMNKDTLAPRFSSTYDLFGDSSTKINFGLNRYYGRNSFAYALKDGKQKLRSRWKRRDPKNYSEWVEDTAWNSRNQKSEYIFRELKIPYDDELAIGINQEIGNFDLVLKYVKRDGKDQVTQRKASVEGISPDGSKYKTDSMVYTNNGISKSDIYTFSIRNVNAYELEGTKHKFELGFNYTDKKSNFSTYDDDTSLDPNIKLDGKYMKSSERPQEDYNKNWTLRFSTISSIPQLNMKWGNMFILENGRKDIKRIGTEIYQGEKIEVFETKRLKKSFVWDTRFGFNWNLPKKSEFFANIDILNVLNRKNAVASENKFVFSQRSFSDVVTYQTGRQFWLELGYRW